MPAKFPDKSSAGLQSTKRTGHACFWMGFDPVQCGIRENGVELVIKRKRGRIGNSGIQPEGLGGGNHFRRVIHGGNDCARIDKFLREHAVTASDVQNAFARFG
jgi:hypothetical protein